MDEMESAIYQTIVAGALCIPNSSPIAGWVGYCTMRLWFYFFLSGVYSLVAIVVFLSRLVSELIGNLVGHLYYFLMFKYPMDLGGRAFLSTPEFL